MNDLEVGKDDNRLLVAFMRGRNEGRGENGSGKKTTKSASLFNPNPPEERKETHNRVESSASAGGAADEGYTPGSSSAAFFPPPKILLDSLPRRPGFPAANGA
jgi:hypothetical protein